MKNNYRPKGFMCANCVHALDNCAAILDFSKMRVIATDSDGTKIVKCERFERYDVDKMITSAMGNFINKRV